MGHMGHFDGTYGTQIKNGKKKRLNLINRFS